MTLMPFPESQRIELPILQELQATGGRDHPRYLYDRLQRYFPALTERELNEKTEAGRSRWHRVVQRAAKQLQEAGELKRNGAYWELTEKGFARTEREALQIPTAEPTIKPPSQTTTHKDAQSMLVEIGFMLGRHAEIEYNHFDVVWRDSPKAPRLSHVFEVQVSGNVDSALTRLKQAYESQRSQLFLVIASENDQRFAGKRLSHTFHELLELVTIIGVGELQRLYHALKAEQRLLKQLTRKQ